jgi:hypothetical protein
MSQAEKKSKFIKEWYVLECTSLSFGDRLKLARIWTNICIKDEEYEMAAAIKEERQKMIKNHIKEKRSKRSFSQKLMIFIYLKKRKISAWLKKMLSR